MDKTKILFTMLRVSVCGETISEEVRAACTPEMLEEVYVLAKRNSLVHLVAHALENCDFPECEVMAKLRKAKMRAIYRYAQMDYAYEQACQVLENAQIPFLPLKGAVIRSYYPEPWMRTSCDIDILVREEDLKRTTDALVKYQWRIHGEINHHDVAMYSPNGVHLDLHHSIKDNNENTDKVLEKVWDYCTLADGKQFEYRQSNEFFWYHLLAHTSRHLIFTGCTIRPFLDMWILRKKMVWDDEKLQKLCADTQLEVFYQSAKDLMDVWFEGKKHTSVTEKMEYYILNRDVQDRLHSTARYVYSHDGRSGNWMQRLFVSYDLLKTTYPILEKGRWLMPLFQLVRWFRKLMDGRFGRFVSERREKRFSREEITKTREFLCDMGLHDK